MDYTLTSFRRRASTLADASTRHAEIKDALKRHAKSQHDLPALWAELVGSHTSDATRDAETAIAVRTTIPTDLIQVLAQADDVAAAFAFVLCCEALAHVVPGDDLAMRSALHKAWLEVEQRKTDADKVQEGFGCDDSPAWRTLRKMNGKPNTAEMVKRLLVIAQLAGAMHSAMCTVARPVVTDDPQSVKGTTQGGDFERLMPAEVAKLASPEMADMQAMRILRGEADQRKMAGKVNKARGPLVICVDESGSMHDEGGVAGRNTWAKAAALALTRIAHSEHRVVRVVHFSTATAVHDVPENDLQAMEDMILTFLGGGTDFNVALQVGIQAVRELAEEGHEGADIVFISDGECHVDEEHLNKMKAEGIKLWTVAIGQHFDPKHLMVTRAERYVYAHDKDLQNRKRAVTLATELTAAATANSKDLN